MILDRFRKPRTVPLDEGRLRRPDFSDGHRTARVILADGKPWWVPKPVVEFRLDFAPDGSSARFLRSGFGDGGSKAFGQEYLDLLHDAASEENEFRGIEHVARVVCLLLRANYALSDAHLRALLPLAADDPQNVAMWSSLSDVVGGIGPKPSPGGSVSPTS